MRHLGAFFVLSVAMSLTGCGQIGGSSNSSRGGMAVVDLDKVAAETGRSRLLSQSLKSQETSLNERFAKTLESANQQLEAQRKSYGEELTETEQKEFTQMALNAKTQLSQIQLRTRQEFEKFTQEQISLFRAEIKPIAQEIAAKRGLGLVIPKNEGLLLSIDPGVDITDEVIKVLREKHPVTTSNVPAAAPVTAPAEHPTETDAEAAAQKVSTTKRNPSQAKATGSKRSPKSTEDQDSLR